MRAITEDKFRKKAKPIECSGLSSAMPGLISYRREDDGVWRSAAGGSLPFSDGDDVENRLLQLLREAGDLSCGSPELAAAVCDWPSHYHLSPQRADLLRPIRHLFAGPVLEIGAGCGALTRYLGETGTPVVAVEGSDRRARIAALRCRDLDNVSVICDRFDAFQWPRRFQAVLLVGVLEYSRLFMDGPDPVARLLRRAAEFLAPDGVLILAIENQLGLKYFAGAPEDHLGLPFHGINNAYRSDSVVTFGRQDLDRRLAAAGFAGREFLFPWPDYKFPVAILHPAAFYDAEFDAAALIRRHAAPDQAIGYVRHFAEEMTWPLLVHNGLAQELANSFLVLARREEKGSPLTDRGMLASIYATCRRPCFAKETSLLRTAGALSVRRRLLYSRPVPAGLPFHQELIDEEYHRGMLYVDALYVLMNRPGWRVEDLVAWSAPWVTFLHRHGDAELGECRLPPEFVDCTPFNIVHATNGQLLPFDLEWIAASAISLRWVAFRGLFWSFANLKSVAPPQSDTPLNLLQLVTQVMDGLGLQTGRRDLDDCLQEEERLFEAVSGSSGSGIRNRWEALRLDCRSSGLLTPPGDDPQVGILRRDIACMTAELAGLERELAERDRRLRQLETQVRSQTAALQDIQGSKAWRTHLKIQAVLTAIQRRGRTARERD
jgi:O-antigen biosynthesis protein